MKLLTRRDVLWLVALLLGLAVITRGVLLMGQPKYVIELEGPVDESEVSEELDEQHSIYRGSYDFSELSPRGKEVFRDAVASDQRGDGKVIMYGGLGKRPELPPDFTYPNVRLESVGVADIYVIQYEGTYYELRTFVETGHSTVGPLVAMIGVFVVLFAGGSWYRERGPPLLSTPTPR